MKTLPRIKLKDVQSVYSGPEGDLWELIMGEQIHIGGFRSSMDLAEKAGIGSGLTGVDLCCATGAGMRFLIRFRDVAKMTGVDATARMIARGRERCRAAGLASKIRFVNRNVCASGLKSGSADFVWGEDAWCYVENKPRLIAEAVRIVRPGGTIAFTDWVEGPRTMSPAEAERYLKFMKFPSILSIDEYSALLRKNRCLILRADNTRQFAPYVKLYLEMIDRQLTYDALRIIGFDLNMLRGLADEMMFLSSLAQAGKIAQGLFVARKP